MAARGRPAARQFIVPANEVLNAQQIDDESWRLGPLYESMHSTEQCLECAAKRRLLHNNVDCPRCHIATSLVARVDNIDGYRWRCRRCTFTKAVCADSFFKDSHLHIRQIVIMMYCWARDVPQTEIAHEADVPAGKTVVDWCGFFRDKAKITLKEILTKLVEWT